MAPTRQKKAPGSAKETAAFNYKGLPAELKLKVWMHVYEEWTPGAHRFKLKVNSKNKSLLHVQADGTNRDDDSAWRARLAIARIDKYAFDGLLKFEKRATNFFKNTSLFRVNVEENGLVATINGREDLVTFRFSYGETQASIERLSLDDNRAQIFRGITHLGVEQRHFDGSQDNRSPLGNVPFHCRCGGPFTPPFCNQNFLRFLAMFPNLKAFYLILNLTLSELKVKDLETKRLVYRKGGMAQQCLAHFEYFQDTARKNGLKEFHDRRGTYCEITRRNATKYLENGPETLNWMQHLYHTWNRAHTNHRHKFNFELKFLVRADLQNVQELPAGTNIRKPKPWA